MFTPDTIGRTQAAGGAHPRKHAIQKELDEL